MSSKLTAMGGSLPRSSMTTTCSRVGQSARTFSTLAYCCRFSTKMSFALTLLMTYAAWPGSDEG